MRLYRVGNEIEETGWPFLAAGHAYLADGTPLTECDEDGRIIPAESALSRMEKICSGGSLRLADRLSGVLALARALDKKEHARAPILLLQLQIDRSRELAKYNPFHKPDGPGGGQFTSGSSAGGLAKPVEWSMHVDLNSTYQRGINGADVDEAHERVMNLVRQAILFVGATNFRPGMPTYGMAIHLAVAAEIKALGDPAFQANPIYLDKELRQSGAIPAGASLPDVVYAPAGEPRVIWEIKTGRAVDTSAPAIQRQREKALENVKGNPLYEYIQIYER